MLGLHACAWAWWVLQQPQALPKSEVTWIQWTAPVPATSQVPHAAPPPKPAVDKLATAIPSAELRPQAPSPSVASPLSSSIPTTPSISSGAHAVSAAASSAGAEVRATEEVVLPSQNAAYLNNPTPPYPAISRRMGEQGRVVVRVLIDDNGMPQQAQLESSSGHARLDQAAVSAVLSWRFVPGRKGGKPQTMWFSVPITFDLKPAQNG